MKMRKSLRELRMAKGWKREQVAVDLGVSITTVANLEKGRHQPRMQLARKIADLFDVSVDDIEWGMVDIAPKALAA